MQLPRLWSMLYSVPRGPRDQGPSSPWEPTHSMPCQGEACPGVEGSTSDIGRHLIVIYHSSLRLGMLKYHVRSLHTLIAA